MREDIESATRRLLALAAGLAQSSGIKVEVCDHQWSWLPKRRVLKVARDSIATHGAEYCYGFVAHEIGHCLVSRYPDFDLSGWSPCIAKSILNAIEDPRAEIFMGRRYPGVRPWIKQAYLITRPATLPANIFERMPYLMQFGMGCVEEYHNRWEATPRDFSPQVREALERTRTARRHYAEMLPADDLSANWTTQLEYDELLPLLNHPPAAPSAGEMAVLVSAFQAFRLAEADILPAAQVLHERDVRQVARALVQEPQLREEARKILGLPDDPAVRAAAEQMLRGLVAHLLSTRVDAAIESDDATLRLTERLLNALWDNRNEAPMPGLPRPMAGTVAPSSTALEPTGPVTPPQTIEYNDYEQLRVRHAADIDQLVREIENVLEPRRHPRIQSGYASGVRLDLRKAMTFEADPRRYDGLWQRRALPERTDLAAFVLVDLSGSMAGDDKDDAAMAGMVILAETLARMPHVRWAAAGFQDEIIPFADFGEGLTLAVRDRIGRLKLEIHNCCPDGHNHSEFNDDGPAVTSAGEQLMSVSATQRLLIVVSDGGPAGRHSTADDLHRAAKQVTASGIDLIGVGLGNGTEHVREYYPRHISEVPVAEFPQRMGTLVREILTR